MIPIPDPILKYNPRVKAQKEFYIRWMAENVPFYDPEDPEYREHEVTQDSILPKNVLWPMRLEDIKKVSSPSPLLPPCRSLEKFGIAEEVSWWCWRSHAQPRDRYIARLRTRKGLEIIVVLRLENRYLTDADIILPDSLEMLHGQTTVDVLEKIRILDAPLEELPLLLAQYQEELEELKQNEESCSGRCVSSVPTSFAISLRPIYIIERDLLAWIDLIERRLRSLQK